MDDDRGSTLLLAIGLCDRRGENGVVRCRAPVTPVNESSRVVHNSHVIHVMLPTANASRAANHMYAYLRPSPTVGLRSPWVVKAPPANTYIRICYFRHCICEFGHVEQTIKHVCAIFIYKCARTRGPEMCLATTTSYRCSCICSTVHMFVLHFSVIHMMHIRAGHTQHDSNGQTYGMCFIGSSGVSAR